MALIQWIAFIFIFGIIVIRGFRPNAFTLDNYSISLLFLLAIPLVAPFLKKVKWFGAEFDFREYIQELSVTVKESQEEVPEGKQPPDVIETFSVEAAKNLVSQDPNLALAALRIEIERVLHLAYKTLIDSDSLPKKGIHSLIKELFNHNIIGKHQNNALHQITRLCNEAVHGGNVSAEEANEVIDLTVKLSESFSLGYSINFQPNSNYKEQGLLCEWEHCIENFPLRGERDNRSCHVFGHDCPGGIGTRTACKKSMDDITDERFSKK